MLRNTLIAAAAAVAALVLTQGPAQALPFGNPPTGMQTASNIELAASRAYRKRAWYRSRGYRGPRYGYRGRGYGRYAYGRYAYGRYGYPRYYRRYPYRRYYGGYGYPWWGFGGPFIGLGFGSYYGYGGYNGGGAYDYDDDYAYAGGNAHVRWCRNRYRSYNSRTDTFLGYDGRRHRCRGPY